MVEDENTPDKFFEDLFSRFPLFGLSSAFRKFQTKEELLDHEEQAIINFANKFTTCTLNESVIEARTEDTKLKKKSSRCCQYCKRVLYTLTYKVLQKIPHRV